MDDFKRFLQYQRDVHEATLEVIRKYQGEQPSKQKRTYKLDLVENILRAADRPLHVSEIIDIAQKDYQVTLERDSIVSALIKKINTGEKFIRTAPNTFFLR